MGDTNVSISGISVFNGQEYAPVDLQGVEAKYREQIQSVVAPILEQIAKGEPKEVIVLKDRIFYRDAGAEKWNSFQITDQKVKAEIQKISDQLAAVRSERTSQDVVIQSFLKDQKTLQWQEEPLVLRLSLSERKIEPLTPGPSHLRDSAGEVGPSKPLRPEWLPEGTPPPPSRPRAGVWPKVLPPLPPRPPKIAKGVIEEKPLPEIRREEVSQHPLAEEQALPPAVPPESMPVRTEPFVAPISLSRAALAQKSEKPKGAFQKIGGLFSRLTQPREKTGRTQTPTPQKLGSSISTLNISSGLPPLPNEPSHLQMQIRELCLTEIVFQKNMKTLTEWMAKPGARELFYKAGYSESEFAQLQEGFIKCERAASDMVKALKEIDEKSIAGNVSEAIAALSTVFKEKFSSYAEGVRTAMDLYSRFISKKVSDDFANFLIQPVQRLPRWALFIKDMQAQIAGGKRGTTEDMVLSGQYMVLDILDNINADVARYVNWVTAGDPLRRKIPELEKQPAKELAEITQPLLEAARAVEKFPKNEAYRKQFEEIALSLKPQWERLKEEVASGLPGLVATQRRLQQARDLRVREEKKVLEAKIHALEQRIAQEKTLPMFQEKRELEGLREQQQGTFFSRQDDALRDVTDFLERHAFLNRIYS